MPPQKSQTKTKRVKADKIPTQPKPALSETLLESKIKENAALKAEIERLHAIIAKTSPDRPLYVEDIGKKVGDEGIYFGVWLPVDQKGEVVGAYDVFADTEDLADTNPTFAYEKKHYYDVCRAMVSEPSDARGHMYYSHQYLDQDHLYRALQSGAAVGKLFIPTFELLTGMNQKGERVRGANLFSLRNTGDFRHTLKTADLRDPERYYCCYASCTMVGQTNDIWTAYFSADGGYRQTSKLTPSLHYRLCRVKKRDRSEVEAQLQHAFYQISTSVIKPLALPKCHEIATLIPDRGIYLGLRSFKKRQDPSVVKNYIVFSDVRDAGAFSFSELRKAIENHSSLGHKGMYLPTNELLSEALEDGSAIGKWVIPPYDVVINRSDDFCLGRWRENMHFRKDEGAFKGTFQNQNYWTNLTEGRWPDDARFVIDFEKNFYHACNGLKKIEVTSKERAVLRLCRFEICKDSIPNIKKENVALEYGPPNLYQVQEKVAKDQERRDVDRRFRAIEEARQERATFLFLSRHYLGFDDRGFVIWKERFPMPML